ncbi:unnamed protein product [Paramecium pentaurelia]|uniref:Uncharacterized protein n=1 Tax=Paramecium pentaurelia TaxID=43138 RepID=A0A8S1XG69_9CILI|nr:unnamed protein product [Paramecium pentaurelia]
MQDKSLHDNKQIRNPSQQTNYIQNDYSMSISTYQSKLVVKQCQLLQFIQRQEHLKNQLYQIRKTRQFSQQQERKTYITKPRAFSIHNKDQIYNNSQPNLINDDSNNETDHCQYQKGEQQSNNFSIFCDNSQKKQKFLPPMHPINQDPFLQTFGKQIDIVTKNRFPKEVFLGNVSKMKKQFQQNFYL